MLRKKINRYSKSSEVGYSVKCVSKNLIKNNMRNADKTANKLQLVSREEKPAHVSVPRNRFLWLLDCRFDTNMRNKEKAKYNENTWSYLQLVAKTSTNMKELLEDWAHKAKIMSSLTNSFAKHKADLKYPSRCLLDGSGKIPCFVVKYNIIYFLYIIRYNFYG